MKSTITNINEWQQALQQEINHLKKYGSRSYRLINGHQLTNNEKGYSYYFETTTPVIAPIGSIVRLEWGSVKYEGRILSSEGSSIIIALESSLGDLIHEAFLFHDPWELLEQLIQRLDEIKKRKKKRLRIRNLLDPSMPAKHSITNIKNNIHELLLRSSHNPITFVWGPPGTGKTYTLARVAANHYSKGKSVLILAQSNQAVDVLISEIYTFLQKKARFQEGEVIRYGSAISETLVQLDGITTSQLLEKREPILALDKERLIQDRRALKQDLSKSFSKRDSEDLLKLEEKISRILDKIRQKEAQFVKDAKIIGTTLAKAASDSSLYEKEFDVIIIDEASMAYVPQAAFATSLGKRSIICGDFKQLPPIASSRSSIVSEWLKEDIFHKSGVVDMVEKGKLHPHLFLLKEQRRMHPDISAFTNKYVYHSLVTDHESVYKKRQAIATSEPFPDSASILVDTRFSGEYCYSDRNSNSRLNLWQLILSFQLIHEAYINGAKSIGYVTPYRVQANLMSSFLNEVYKQELETADIIAATVHRFQGSEREVMVFDTVDSYPKERVGMLLTGKESERLINVAITRTKGKFIHISDTSFIQSTVFKNKTIRQLVDFQQSNHHVITNQQIGTWIKNQHTRIQWIHAKKEEKVFQDLFSAKQSITICSPNQSIPTKWLEVINKRQSKVKLTVLTDDYPEELNPNEWRSALLPFPFVMIDDYIVWLGFPFESMRRVQPPYVAARINSRVICEELLNHL